jgi:hypothetical protein
MCREPNKRRAVSQTTRLGFLHRHNRDGAVDSVCMRCFITIDSESTENELGDAENTHVCRGFNLARILHPEAYSRHSNRELPDRPPRTVSAK